VLDTLSHGSTVVPGYAETLVSTCSRRLTLGYLGGGAYAVAGRQGCVTTDSSTCTVCQPPNVTSVTYSTNFVESILVVQSDSVYGAVAVVNPFATTAVVPPGFTTSTAIKWSTSDPQYPSCTVYFFPTSTNRSCRITTSWSRR
jgi:hypothetical protein